MNSVQWFQFIMSYAIQVSLVIGFAWGFERWTRPSQAKNRIWTACYISLLGLFAAGLVLPRLEFLHPWSTLQNQELLFVTSTENSLGILLLAIWVLGTSVMLVRWVVHFLRLHRFLQDCPVVAENIRQRLLHLAADYPTEFDGRQVDFRISPEEAGAFCYQFHQPIVCLPQSVINGEAHVLTCVLHHELTHLSTQHPLHLFLQKLVQTLLWFHPLVWASTTRQIWCVNLFATML